MVGTFLLLTREPAILVISGRWRTKRAKNKRNPTENNFFLVVFVPTIEKGEDFVLGCGLVFFHAKLDATNNHRTGLSDIA